MVAQCCGPAFGSFFELVHRELRMISQNQVVLSERRSVNYYRLSFFVVLSKIP